MKFIITEQSEIVGRKGSENVIESDTYVDDKENSTLIITHQSGLVKWIVKYESIQDGPVTAAKYVTMQAGTHVLEGMNPTIANVVAQMVSGSQIKMPLNLGMKGPRG